MFRKISNAVRNVNAYSTVEERRFSAASSLRDDVGFSPGSRICRRSRLIPLTPSLTLRRPLARVLVAVAILALASSFFAHAQKPADVSVNADLPAGPMQAKATTSCLECHEARIILQQRLSKAAWTKEVDKMTKWGAVIDPADRDALIDYLSANFSPDKAAYEPQRTSQKSGSSKTK
jgi:hypothetical protein